MKFGYARVSTHEQNLDLQVDVLKAAGSERIYQKKASGSKAEWPEMLRMLNQLRTGDTVIIWKQDRLGRSLAHLIKLVSDPESQGVGLLSLNDPINTLHPRAG